jgi:ribosomal protein S25
MDNKKLGIILIAVSIVLLVLLMFIRSSVVGAYQKEIDAYIEVGEACPSDPDECPHEQRARAQIPIFIAGALLIGVISLGVYLIFFEKSQKAIISTLKRQRQVQTKDEKFNILLKGLDTDERKVVKAVKEQDGITQQTLRLRTDMHKSKLSIVLDGLEKKGLIKRVAKGKTKQVFLKIAL